MRGDTKRACVARVQHAIWAHWMTYLFSVSVANVDGSVTIPPEKVKRWRRQAATPFAYLPAAELESDFAQADKVLAALAALAE